MATLATRHRKARALAREAVAGRLTLPARPIWMRSRTHPERLFLTACTRVLPCAAQRGLRCSRGARRTASACSTRRAAAKSPRGPASTRSRFLGATRRANPTFSQPLTRRRRRGTQHCTRANVRFQRARAKRAVPKTSLLTHPPNNRASWELLSKSQPKPKLRVQKMACYASRALWFRRVVLY